MEHPASSNKVATASTLHGLADKLVHPLLEVRRRSLQSLDFKIKHGLLTQDDFVQERSVLRNLLGLLQHPDNGEQVDATALLLLQRVAASFPVAARQLLQMGSEDLLRSVRACRSPDIQQLIDSTLGTLTSAPVAPSAAGSDVPSTPLHPVAALQHSMSLPSTTLPAMRTSGGGAASTLGTSQHAVVRPLEQEFAGALGQYSSQGQFSASTPLQTPWSGAQSVAYSGVVNSINGWPASVAPAQRPGTASSMGSVQQGAPAITANTSMPPSPPRTRRQWAKDTTSTQQTPAAPGSGARGQLQPTMQLAVSGQPVLELAAQFPASCTDWLLQPVALAPTDEQHLFDQVVRLQHVEDPVHIALPALQELLHGAAADMPAEVLLSQPGLLDCLLTMLASTTDASAPIQAPAVALLIRLFCGLKESLLAATHPLNSTAQSRGTSDRNGGVGSSTADAPPVAGSTAGGTKYTGGRWRQGGVDAATVALQAASLAAAGSTTSGDAADISWYPAGLPQLPAHLQQGPHLTRHIELHGLVNASALACAVALRVLPLLASPGMHALVLPLAQELLPWLLVGSHGSTATPGDEAARTKLALLLQPLAHALTSCIAIARSESAAIIQAYQDSSDSEAQPPVLSVPVMHILILSTRLLLGSTPDCWVHEVVPPALSETLAAVETDALCVVAAPPGWAASITPVVERLRPDVRLVLGVAHDGQAAVTAATQLQQQLPHLLSGTVAPTDWLHTLQSSLLALDLVPGDTTLLQTMIQGVAYVCSSQSMEGPSVQAQAEGVVLALLAHPLPTAQLATYTLFEELINKVRSEPEPALVGLLTRRRVCEHLVTLGLADPRLRPHAASVLLLLLHRGQREVNAELLHWASWVACYSSDSQVSALACALELVQQASARQEANKTPLEWTQLEVPLVQLFSSRVDVRQAASQSLRDLLHTQMGAHVPGDEPQSSDPFKAVLDGGLRDPLALPGGAPVSGGAGGGSQSDRLGRSFRPQDVENLLSILGNTSLATDLRKSSAAQLLGLVAEPNLCEHMAQPQALTTMLQAVTTTLSLYPTLREALDHLDMSLPAAAANLLYAVVSLSPRARAWVVSSTGGLLLVLRALPLSFHSLITMRHSMARLLAALALGKQADKWEGWSTTGARKQAKAQAGQEGMAQGALLCLPRPFSSGYLLPVKVIWVEVVSASPPSPGSALGQTLDNTLVKGKPKLQELVASQRFKVALLVEQRRLLDAARGDLSQCAALLQSQPGAWTMGAGVIQCCCHNISALSLIDQVESGLQAVASATSHAEGRSALARLAQLAASDQGLAALAGSSWQQALEQLLINSPLSLDDRQLWLDFLPLVQRLIASGYLGAPHHLHLALCFNQSILPLLSEPKAAGALPTVPVALAGSLSLEDATGAPSTHWVQLVTLQTTQQVLVTLLQLLHHARQRLTVSEVLQVVRALGAQQLCAALVKGFVGTGDVDYGCRVLAVAVLGELLGALQAETLLRQDGQEKADLTDLEDALVDCLVAILTQICNPTPTALPRRLTVEQTGQQDEDVYEGMQTEGSVPSRDPGAGNTGKEGVFQGKALIRQALICVGQLVKLLPIQLWPTIWQQESSVYWLTRLLRDRDVRLRMAALDQLTLLIRPGADITQQALAAGWPDAAPRLMRLAVSETESYGVRAAALRFLCTALAMSGNISDTRDQQRLIIALSAESLLRQTQFWDQLPTMLLDKAAPSAFVHGALCLLLQGLVVDVETFSKHLRFPSLLQHIVNMLTPSEQSLLVSSGRAASAPVHALLSAGSRNVSAHSPRSMISSPCSDLCDTSVSLVISAGFSSQSAAHRSPAMHQGMMVATMQPVPVPLILNPQPPAQQPSNDSSGNRLDSGAGQQVDILSCCSTVAQIATLAVMDEDVLQGGGLGLSYGRLLELSLAALVRVGHSVPQIDRLTEHGVPASTTVLLRQALQCTHELLVLAGNLAHILPPQQLITACNQAQSLLSDQENTPLLVVLSEVLEARTPPSATYLAAANLVATLLATPATAETALHAHPAACEPSPLPASHEEHVCGTSGEPVGAALCLALVSLCSLDLLAPAPTQAEAEHLGQDGAQSLQGESLVYVVALRNTLAYSSAAKVAALRVGLHTGLLGTCAAAQRWLETAARRAHGRHSSGGGAVQCTAAGSLAAGASAGRGGSRPVTAAQGHGAALRRKARGTGGLQDQQPGLQRPEQDAPESDQATEVVEGWSSPLASPSKVGTVSSRTPALSPVSQAAAGRDKAGTRPATAAARAFAPGKVLTVRSSAVSVQGSAAEKPVSGCLLAQQPRLEVRVTVALSLLKHLAYHSAPSRQILLRSGLLEAVRQLWRLGLMPMASTACDSWPAASDNAQASAARRRSSAGAASGAGGGYFVASPALHEALGLVANMLPDCPEARAALVRDGPPTLLQLILSLVFECKLEASTWSLALTLLSHLSATQDGAAALLRGGSTVGLTAGGAGGEGFLGAAQSAVVGSLEAGTPVKQRDLMRGTTMLQVLTNIAAHSEGQKAILKSGGFPRLMELVLSTGGPLGGTDDSGGGGGAGVAVVPAGKQWPEGLVQSSLLLLRNLCFSTEARAHLLVHPRLLHALLGVIEQVASRPQAATTAASAVWALIYQGEKVKAALRRVPNAMARLTGARAAAEFHAARLANSQSQQSSKVSKVSHGSGQTSTGALRWFNDAAECVANVVQLMDSTMNTVEGGKGAAREGAVVGKGGRPGSGALRDQNEQVVLM